MKRKILFIAVLAVFISPSFIYSQPDSGQVEFSIPIEKHVLDNGLTVLLADMPASSTVSLYALVKAGSATEGPLLGTGISHFLEHMLFKGTEKRAVGVISSEIQAMGGTINAATSFDYTIYTITVPADAFEKALDVLADMLINSQFDPEELEKERTVVYGEIKLHKDNPQRRLSELVFDTVFIKHPYRIPIIGYVELLAQLDRDDFFDYYKTFYIPNNIVFSVAGRIDPGEALPKIKDAFKGFQRQRYVSRNLPVEPDQISARQREETYPTDLTRMSLSYAGVSILDKDMYAMDVLSMILGSGESSRLYLELFKRQKLVRSVHTSNFTPMDRGLFEIECVLDEENVDATIDAAKAQIRLIQDKGISPEELAKAKRGVMSQHIFGHQTSENVAYSMAVDEAFVGDHDFSKKYVDQIRNLTADDIARAARTYLTDRNFSVVILRPDKDSADQAADTQAYEEDEIRKTVLSNGMTILLKENHSIPLVAVNLSVQGGTRYETPEVNGLSELTARLWTKGTKTRDADTIAQSVESRGAGLAGFAGRNSLGLRFDFLASDTDFGMELLEDLVRHPVFDPDELKKEKEKVKTGILARDDSIFHVTSKTLKELLFLEHPFRLDGLGTMESVERISRDDIAAYYRQLVVPGNIVLSVFGDIDSNAVLKALTQRFSSLKSSEIPEVSHQEAPPEETREKTVHMDREQAMLMIGFRGVDLHHEDYDGLAVLSSLLGSSFSGRMFTKIRDEFGQAYSLGGSIVSSLDTGMLYFYVLTTDENVLAVKDSLVELFEEIKKNPVSDQELRDMRTYLKGTFQMGIETNSALGFATALDELYGLGFGHYKFYEARIEAVTKEDVQRLAQAYLNMNQAAVVITRPQKNGKE